VLLIEPSFIFIFRFQGYLWSWRISIWPSWSLYRINLIIFFFQ